ncbi:hypothetical protein PoB_003392800 [Plakobranchus ocellatus]|uniref:Uncharacterized protein n=1 Tax=Plakobranchus ocellatus TaxID=259542 RepID=A0AAV4ALH9_9GAST|nr:hypothetical protein PoB_003392800 [Plakobranchus ocellatus]
MRKQLIVFEDPGEKKKKKKKRSNYAEADNSWLSDLRLSGPPPGQGASSGARTCDRKVPANLSMDSLATVPPTRPVQVVPSTSCHEADDKSLLK